MPDRSSLGRELEGGYNPQNPVLEKLFQMVQQLEALPDISNQRHQNEERSLFTREIEIQPLPPRFKLSNISPYYGDSDLYDHLDAFDIQMDLQTSNLLVKCRVFPATFGDVLRT